MPTYIGENNIVYNHRYYNSIIVEFLIIVMY